MSGLKGSWLESQLSNLQLCNTTYTYLLKRNHIFVVFRSTVIITSRLITIRVRDNDANFIASKHTHSLYVYELFYQITNNLVVFIKKILSKKVDIFGTNDLKTELFTGSLGNDKLRRNYKFFFLVYSAKFHYVLIILLTYT